MPGGHHPCGPIEHRAEIIPLAQFGFTGRNPHPHRQFEGTLGVHRRIHRRFRGAERSAHTVAGVLEQEPVIRLDRRAQHLVVDDERRFL